MHYQITRLLDDKVQNICTWNSESVQTWYPKEYQALQDSLCVGTITKGKTLDGKIWKIIIQKHPKDYPSI